MIYLQNIPTAQAVFIPKNGPIPSGELTFKAFSTIDREIEIDAQVIDVSQAGLYLHLAVAIQGDIPNGEYEYTLTGDGDILSTGLLIVGEGFGPDQYEKVITYEQYEAE